MTCLDVQMLGELAEALGEELKEITGYFIGQLDGQVADIRAAHEAGDAQRLNRLAHALKGSAANMGAISLAQAAATIEKLAQRGEIEPTTPQVASLPTLAAEAAAALRAAGFAHPA